MGNLAATRRPWARLGAVVAAAALGAVLVGCGSGSTQPQSDAPGGVRGAELYQANCASCHGEDLRGTAKGPSHLSVVYEPNHHSDDSFRSAVANGAPAHHWSFGDMPPVAGLTSAEVDAIIAFVRQVQEEQGLE